MIATTKHELRVAEILDAMQNVKLNMMVMMIYQCLPVLFMLDALNESTTCCVNFSDFSFATDHQFCKM